MMKPSTETVQQVEETYIIAAALGSPLDAPTGSIVYRVAINDVDWLDVETVVNSRAKAQQVIIDAAKRRFNYLTHFQNLLCPKCDRQALLKNASIAPQEKLQPDPYFVCPCGHTWEFPFKKETLNYEQSVSLHRAASCKITIQRIILE